MPTTEQPPVDYVTIVAGADWDWKQRAIDDDTREDFDWTSGPWHVEAEIRNHNDRLLARLANFGSPDGPITLDAEGMLTFHLDAAVTAGLPITRTYINSTDPRIATWRNRGAHAFDVIATNTSNDTVVPLVSGAATVQQRVTD